MKPATASSFATPSRWRPHGGSTASRCPAGELLERGYRLDRETIRRLKASADDDALRDEDGVVSEEQIDRDIDALRRDTQPYLAASSNGDTPGAAKSIDDRVRRETYEHMYKLLTVSDAERKSVTRGEKRTEPIKVASFPC